MEFLILGPIEVRHASRVVALGGIKPRAVLAVLLLHANESVSAERLALALWGEDAPGGAVKTVQVHVSRLRKALGDPGAVSTTAAGYRLRVRGGELDAERFEGLVEDGRRALADGQSEEAAAILREALALWRGPPLADLAFEPFAGAEIARLEEERLAALELRVEADLGAGRHAEIVGELARLVADNPLREQLAGALMLALYRCGRQADALEAYAAARRVLVTQLGVEPGPQLRELHEAILRQDVALRARPAEAELPAALDASSAQPLAGREDELALLLSHWELARGGAGMLVALTGARGAGKSRLAAELARAVHRPGVTILHAAGDGAADAVVVALRRARQATRPTLLVVDDADRAGPAVHTELAGLAAPIAGAPVLVLVCARDALALAHLRAADTLELGPLGEQAVRAIAARYAPGTAAEVPTDWLLAASGGVASRVHALAGQWARREAARHVGVVAGRAEAGRAALRSIEAELTGGVAELQETRERTAMRAGDAAEVVCPFKGLASYDVADAPYYFGRERLVAELVARLAGAPLLGVVGPSGSGKSSVMRAGLLPALAGGVLPGSKDWQQALMRPGPHPARELATALAGLGDGGRAVLAIDQFEETFTVCADEAERSQFVAQVVAAAHDPAGRYVVILALRADHYGRCAAYPELSALLATSNVLVGSMLRDELQRAIEGPSARAGLRVEAALVDALVDDVEHEPGGLPLLSTALLELWQRRDGRRLRHDAYRQIGGVRGAVARLAEDAFGQLDPGRQAIARRVLTRLTGDGPGGAVERRRLALDELEVERDEDVARVVALLTDRRMLTVTAGSIELAHEALLREWPRLRGWIEEDREGLRIQRGLSDAALEWQRLDRDPGALYRGTRLGEAVEWSADGAASLNELEREFLSASVAARARERATRRRRGALVLAALSIGLVAAVVAALFANRQRAIAESRDLATKSATLLQTDAGLAFALALEALRRHDSEQARNAVRQATLEHRATNVIAAHDGLAFGVATSPDGRLAATAGGDRTVRVWNLRSGRRAGQISGYGGEVRAVSFSPDGRRIASAARDGELAVAPATGGARKVVARLKGDFASGVEFVDSQTLAVGTDGGRVALVRLSDGTLRDLNARAGGGRPYVVYAIDVDDDRRRIVSASDDGVARIWSAGGGRPLELAHAAPVIAASFSPDGARVATADVSGAVLLWDAGSGRRLAKISFGDTPQASVRFSDDATRILTAGADGVLHLSEDRPGAMLAELRGHDGPARAGFVPGSSALISAGEEDGTLRTWDAPSTRLAPAGGRDPTFSPDGRLVVSGDDAGAISIWDPRTGRQRTLPAHARTSVARFSHDGKQIVSAGYEGTVRLWDVARGRSRPLATFPQQTFAVAFDPTAERIAVGGRTPLVIQAIDGSHRLRLIGHRGPVNALAFSPDGRHLLTASDDATARIWDARSGKLERTLRAHEAIVRGVAYSDDGRRLATTGSDGTIAVWDAGGGEPVLLVGHEDVVHTAAFSPRGDRVVSAGQDGTVRVWDAAGGEPLVVVDRHPGGATGADFSADGRYVVSAGEDGLRIVACEVCGGIAGTLRLARTRAQRTLTALERRRLLPGG